MNKFHKFLSIILFFCLNQFFVNAAAIKSIERRVGKLHISIDPRLELLAIVHLLSGNTDLANKNSPYSKDIIDFFESFPAQNAVKLTKSLMRNYDFAYDAPVTFMLCLSQPSELTQQIEYSDYLLKRSGCADNLEQYREAIKQFAETSDFERFWNSKIPFYNQILDMTIAEIGDKDIVKTIEEYYGETQGSYNIIITPAFYGGKGSNLSKSDGKKDIYACLSTTNIKNNIPYLDIDNLLFLTWHEFGHSFVNPLTEKYLDKVSSSNKLFEPIRDNMSKQTYGTWDICVNEHIIRAVHARLAELNSTSQQLKALFYEDINSGFIYLEPLAEKLKDFENQRNKNNITFSEYYPELLNVLDSLQKIEY